MPVNGPAGMSAGLPPTMRSGNRSSLGMLMSSQQPKYASVSAPRGSGWIVLRFDVSVCICIETELVSTRLLAKNGIVMISSPSTPKRGTTSPLGLAIELYRVDASIGGVRLLGLPEPEEHADLVRRGHVLESDPGEREVVRPAGIDGHQ